ncbi:3-keto-5-aminohexanoate cleavage protein [Natronocalculus amylovorans]|uniref:3-keto-5-aminohexanoate cleavage protein n=1 Tax=Natronocalculus amylovorans TaxID=2917812 RepID=A0AAE3FZ10_9EURY|nr:3-keto-5-aminohexanoate cleavage protein [Natronocalculus amylovorans]MCL9818162.1 3-keto-5-aminohexanoate cleavage protein [Natronocalculus amylovorans]NUE03885.1 3-keto-5-aminohexanoate cleavage protein [Halorubraceae archaeon YAN]
MAYTDYLNRDKLMLTVATTGGVHGKDANPNLPEQPEEIAEQVRECEKLGAAIVHVHGRSETGENNSARLQEVNDAIRERCDDIIIQNTTGGQAVLEERIKGIRTDPLPEMASLDMGPFNRDRHIITEHNRHNIDLLAEEMQSKGIKPELEVFNNGHLNEVYRLIETGLLDEPYYINIIFGGGTFSIPSPKNVLNLVQNLPDNSKFNLLATGPHQLPLTTMGMILGGHVRVGMEDNLYFRRGEPVKSNAQLVERAANIASNLDRELATPDEAREILGMK